ncbi:MAG: hypothetical protein C6W54_15005 [Bacillaceae bacterium]|nr:MAG: hypothetical protein C6W54_15005 [Bacillaceae bacterium]
MRRTTNVFKKINGNWKLVQEHLSQLNQC